MHRRLFQLWILNESYALAREVRETKRRSLVHFGIVSGSVITLSWRFQKTAWDPLKCAGTNVDHWSIFVSFLTWWAHCTGACKKLHEANWSAREWTQIIGPFWYRFWLGDHIVMTFDSLILFLSLVLLGFFLHMTRITSVVRLTCCTSIGSFLKHSPHHANYSRLFQSICWFSYFFLRHDTYLYLEKWNCHLPVSNSSQ